MKYPCEKCGVHCPENGCVVWKRYFIQNRNKHISEAPAAKPMVREFFRYEHPDLVREGIVFENRIDRCG